MEQVQFIGANELEEGQQLQVRGIVGEFLKKLKKISPVTELIVHIKQYHKESRSKFSVHVRFIAPKHNKEASADSFNLLEATHDAMEAIEKQLRHEH